MNIAAFLLGLAAIFVFVMVYAKARFRWADIALGFALLTTAWMIQLLWDTPHVVHGHL